MKRALIVACLILTAACSEDDQTLDGASGDGSADGSVDTGIDGGFDSGALDGANPDGSPGDGEVADEGAIDVGPVCTPDVACATNPSAPCSTGLTACTGTVTTCLDDLPVDNDGTACAAGLCAGGDCLGPTVISTDIVLTTDSVTPGRTCAEAPQFSVRSLGPSGATLTSTPTADCLATGDEILLINLQGNPNATDNVGRWELLQVESVGGRRVQFATPKVNSYGDTAGSDQGIGIDPLDQKVIVVRVPRYGALTIQAGVSLTASPWDGTTGGVLAIRAASFSIEGTISAERLGYRLGRWSQDDSDCDDNLATEAGESITGPGLGTTDRNAGGSGGLSALNDVSFNSNNPINASAGHAFDGEPGVNPVGRVIGEPGAAYGAGDGSLLTMGSGVGGNVTCDFVVGPVLIELGGDAGGIVFLAGGDLAIAPTGRVSASAIPHIRDTASSGGYVLLYNRSVDLGDGLVTAEGALAITGSPPTAGEMIEASPGYVVLSVTGTVTGTTAPPAAIVRR